MTQQTSTPLTVFMLVKTRPEWLGFPVPERFRLLREHIEPILKTHGERVSLRFYDTEFYSARVTDVWVWDAHDRHAYELVVEALRETPFWDRYFDIVEILPGVENAYASNYGEAALSAG
ncbi:darcynin [Burkholderia sp. JP2-270]|uniref:darcynin family protein n=1 Tax=Burkholderia sp. JP2-270 TaxID=2217913 RepID=UPI000DA2C076|nr:darcynin family protein [Burkholderia sp. JP2-270]AWV02107.1 darcynin [Burkholderia sp. JP2-270]